MTRTRAQRSSSPRCSPHPTSPAASSTCSRAGATSSRPHLASHLDVDALDLPGGDAELERAAADNVKRVVFSRPGQSLYEISSFLELKTVWHPMGQ